MFFPLLLQRFNADNEQGKMIGRVKFSSFLLFGTHLVLNSGEPGAPLAGGGRALSRQANEMLLGVRGDLGGRAAVVVFLFF